jgi:hypothetical protein
VNDIRNPESGQSKMLDNDGVVALHNPPQAIFSLSA